MNCRCHPQAVQLYIWKILLRVFFLSFFPRKRGFKLAYYIDIDEIPGFLLLLKNHIFTARSEHIIFIFHMWGYRCCHGNQHV